MLPFVLLSGCVFGTPWEQPLTLMPYFDQAGYPFTIVNAKFASSYYPFNDPPTDAEGSSGSITSLTLPMPLKEFPLSSIKDPVTSADTEFYYFKDFIENREKTKRMIFCDSNQVHDGTGDGIQSILELCQMRVADTIANICEVEDLTNFMNDANNKFTLVYLAMFNMEWRMEETQYIENDAALTQNITTWRQGTEFENEPVSLFPVDFQNSTRFANISDSSWYGGAVYRWWPLREMVKTWLMNVHTGYMIKQWHWDIRQYDIDVLTNTDGTGPSQYTHFSKDFRNVGDDRWINDKGKNPSIESIHAYNYHVVGDVAYRVFDHAYFTETLPLRNSSIVFNASETKITLEFEQTPKFETFYNNLNWRVASFEFGTHRGTTQKTNGCLFAYEFNMGVPPYVGSWEFDLSVVPNPTPTPQSGFVRYQLTNNNTVQYNEYRTKIGTIDSPGDCSFTDVGDTTPPNFIKFVPHCTIDTNTFTDMNARATILNRTGQLSNLDDTLTFWKTKVCGSGVQCSPERLKCLLAGLGCEDLRTDRDMQEYSRKK